MDLNRNISGISNHKADSQEAEQEAGMSFSGFAHEVSGVADTLKELRAIVEASRVNIREYQSANVRNSLQMSRQESPRFSTPILTSIAEEMYDYIPEMERGSQRRTGLRSQGTVADTPWVQSKILVTAPLERGTRIDHGPRAPLSTS